MAGQSGYPGGLPDEIKNRKAGETWGVIDLSNPELSDPPIVPKRKDSSKKNGGSKK